MPNLKEISERAQAGVSLTDAIDRQKSVNESTNKVDFNSMSNNLNSKATRGSLLVPNLNDNELSMIKENMNTMVNNELDIYDEAVDFFVNIKGIPKEDVTKIQRKSLIHAYNTERFKKEEDKEPIKEEVKEEVVVKKEVDNETEEGDKKEVTIGEAIGMKKENKKSDRIVNYQPKPTNSYKRLQVNKHKKLLSRQKRGKYVDVFLPNSNITLRVFELRQKDAIMNIMSGDDDKDGVFTKREVLKTILERSTAIASDGEDIDADTLLHFISHDDVGYIYMAEALANTQEQIPYTVRCENCGSVKEVGLDVARMFEAINKKLPKEVVNGFVATDTFEKQVKSSIVGVEGVVTDEEARAKIYVSMPSLESHIGVSSFIKNYIVAKFEDLIPDRLAESPVVEKYRYLLNTHASSDVELITSLTDCIMMFYIRKIELYEFNTDNGNWDDEKNIVTTIDETSTIDETISTIGSLETTTLDKIDDALADLKRTSIVPSTGMWRCGSCKAGNDTQIMGLEPLMTSLHIKTQKR